MFLYIVLTPVYTTSGLLSTGNTRKYQQIDVYIYQCVFACFSLNERTGIAESDINLSKGMITI